MSQGHQDPAAAAGNSAPPPMTVETELIIVEMAALKRSAAQITVEAEGGKVTLPGRVRSWTERQEAERAAWRAPGVTMVNDRVSIGA